MGLSGSSCFLVFVTVPMDHSLLSEVSAGLPHDGVRRAGCLKLFRDLQADLRIRTLNEVIPPIVPMGTTATRLFRRELVRVSSCCCKRRDLAPAEVNLVAPHAMQDDGKLASYGDAGLGHAAPLGNAHPPRLQG